MQFIYSTVFLPRDSQVRVGRQINRQMKDQKVLLVCF